MTTPAKWEKLPALPGRANPCGNCPPIGQKLSMGGLVAVGFGDAHVERDGETVYAEPNSAHGQEKCGACDGWGWVGDGHKTMCATCEGSGLVPDGLTPPAEYWEVSDAEKAAAADPEHDWRIVLFGPLHGEVYQRHGPEEWNLVEKNEGFA